jgi:hypothetical protein
MSDRVLLISFPKSGSNWVRYCVEHFSGRRTPGKARKSVLVSEGPTVFDRMHLVDKRHRNLFMHARARQGLEDYEHADKTGLHGWLSTWRKERRVREVTGRRLLLLPRHLPRLDGFRRRDPPQALARALCPRPRPAREDALFDFTYHSRDLPPKTRAALQTYCGSYLGADLYDSYLGCVDRLGEAMPQRTIGSPRTS